MKCPKCEIPDIIMAERSGVEIDYCTACRGVWLDRGELDKIIDRASLADSYAGQSGDRKDRDFDHGRGREDDDNGGSTGHRNRRRGLLGDLFDF